MCTLQVHLMVVILITYSNLAVFEARHPQLTYVVADIAKPYEDLLTGYARYRKRFALLLLNSTSRGALHSSDDEFRRKSGPPCITRRRELSFQIQHT